MMEFHISEMLGSVLEPIIVVHKADGQSHSMKQFQMIMARQLKGELGLRLLLWKSGKQEAKEAAAEAAVLKQTRNSAGVKMLKQALARLAKGELGLRLLLWKSGKQEEKEAAAEMKTLKQAMTRLAKGDLRLKQTRNSAGVKMLKQALARLAKGELGLRLLLWKSGKQEAKEAANDATHALALASRNKSQAMKMLQQVFALMTKGKQGLRLLLWRCGKQDAKEAAAEAAMAAVLKQTRNSAGVKMLKQALARLAKGELGLRLLLWKSGKQEAKEAAAMAAADVAMAAALEQTTNSASVCQLESQVKRLYAQLEAFQKQVNRLESQLAQSIGDQTRRAEQDASNDQLRRLYTELHASQDKVKRLESKLAQSSRNQIGTERAWALGVEEEATILRRRLAEAQLETPRGL